MTHHTVGASMTSNPTTISSSTSITEAARLMRDEDTGILPIVDGDRLTAVLTDRDIVVRGIAEGKDITSASAGDIASQNLVTIDPQQPLDEAARLMAEHQVRRLPVCEEDGRLVGMLSQADLARAGRDQLVGDTVQKISQ
jgi:CBS domain-containing protein